MVFKMPDEAERKKKEEEEALEKKKLEDDKEEFVKKQNQFNQERLDFKREQLVEVSNGKYNKERADKLNSIPALDALIEDYKLNKSQEPEKNEDSEEQKVKINVGMSSVKFPDGSTVEIDPVNTPLDSETRLNYFLDPFKVGRQVTQFHKDARINYLPPTDEHPWNRQIA